MSEIFVALKNPGWWILTVAVGLLLNVFAPFVNRWIESTWAARSARKRQLMSADEAAIEQKVKELAGRPSGLVEAKLDAMYWLVRIILVLTIYLMMIQLCFSIPMLPVQLAVAPLSLVAFFSITGFWRRWKRRERIHDDLRRELERAPEGKDA